MSKGTVFVVDDDEDIRHSVYDLVVSVGLACQTYDSAHTFLKADTETGPSAVVLDVRLPGMGGLEIQEHLLAKGATAPIIFITAYGDVWTAVHAMKRGAVDFIEKPFSGQALLGSIQAAIKAHGERLAEKANLISLYASLRRLTPREVEILTRLGAGKSNNTIAEELALSVRTVEFHRANMMRKLKVSSREEVTRIAVEIRVAQLSRLRQRSSSAISQSYPQDPVDNHQGIWD